ncbi:MAG: hypothetical protein ACRDGN_03200 [bacterium]
MLFTGSRGEAYKTEREIGIGIPGASVAEAFRASLARVPANPSIIIYDEISVACNIMNDRVATIVVFRPRTARAIYKL